MSILGLMNTTGNNIRYEPSTDQWKKNKDPISFTSFILDHTSVKTGWGCIAEGKVPDWRWDNSLGVSLAQPTKEYRRGFSACLWVRGHGRLDWVTNSVGSCMGFDAVFELVWSHKDAHPGEFAEIQYTGSQPIRVGKGNTRKPLFQVTGWVPQASIPSEVKVTPPVTIPNGDMIAQSSTLMQSNVALPFNR